MNLENILAKMISDITGLEYELLKDNIVFEANELPIGNKNEKAKKCDFVIKFDRHNILNLELNRHSYGGLLIKNLSYLFQIFSAETKKGEKYDKDLVVMQINLNCFKDSKNDKPLNRYHIREDNDNSVYIDNFVIYNLNIVKCHELYYNESVKENLPKYIKWGEFIYCEDFSKISEITKGIMSYEERNLIMDRLDKITKDDIFMSKAEALHWAEWEKNSIYDDGLKQGIEQGIEQGIKEGFELGIDKNTNDIIKSMLDNKIKIEVISKVTGKAVSEIEMMKNE